MELVRTSVVAGLGEVDGDAPRRALAALEPLPISSGRRQSGADRSIEADGESDALRPHLTSLNPAMSRVIGLASDVALGDTTVLLSGETGTGKEVLARHIHMSSKRASRPFVALNCGALPSQLVESELFGHERGAFSGAIERRIGHFEAAHGGTLLLDELSELPLSLQTRLLRVLQEREIMRVGASRPTPVDVRVIATTNRDLREMVERGEFRRDLFYRLNVFPLVLVPLRERMEDLPELARRLLSRLAASFSRSAILTGRALERLMYHDWPGNVRELANVLERALIMSPRGFVDAEAIVFDEHTGLGSQVVELLRPKVKQPVAAVMPRASSAEQAASVGLKALERETILRTLAQFGGNRTRASAELGISVRTLRYKLAAMRESGVDVPEPSVGV